jgi:hypothetical protein
MKIDGSWRFKEPRETRRANEDEKPIIHRTAQSLASRFNTTARWIEEILTATIRLHDKDLALTELERYKKQDSIISDNDLISFFSPSVFEMLSILGWKKTFSIFKINPDQYEEVNLRVSSDKNYFVRALTNDEELNLALIRKREQLFSVFFSEVPPPILLGEEASIEDETISDILRLFREHLLSQEESYIGGSIDEREPFEHYPWFEIVFKTGVRVPRIIFEKGLLKIKSMVRPTEYFKNEEERKSFEENETQPIIVSLPKIVRSGKYQSQIRMIVSSEQDKAKSIKSSAIEFDKLVTSQVVVDEEKILRRKLFKLRIQTIDYILNYLDGLPSREPVDALSEYIQDNFSKADFQALMGQNPKHFNLPEHFEYTFADQLLPYSLIRAAIILPKINDSRAFHKLYQDMSDIFDYSKDVEGSHLLNFTYCDMLDQFSPSKVEQICGRIEDIFEQLSAVEKRQSEIFSRAFMLRTASSTGLLEKSKLDTISTQLADRIDVVIPYLKEILQPDIKEKPKNRVGIFTEGFREYHPRDKSLGIIRFTDLQAKVIQALYEAHESAINGELKRLTLVERIYPAREAAEIRAKHGQKVIKKDGSESSYKYEWRLEKTIIKENHPAWRLGLVRLGRKIGSDKSYRLDLEFESKK